MFAYSAVLNSCIWIESKEFNAILDRFCYCLTDCYGQSDYLVTWQAIHPLNIPRTHFSTRKCLHVCGNVAVDWSRWIEMEKKNKTES